MSYISGENHPINHEETDSSGRDSVTLAMGEVSVQETAETIMDIPELSAERQAFMVDYDPNKKYLVGCGDDRPATLESAAKLSAEYDVSGEEYIRYYGALTGVSRILAVSIAAQYGAETLAKYGNSFEKFEAEVTERIERTSNVLLAEHSAEDNEGNPTELNLESEKGLGCAYCAGVGAVTGLCDGNVAVDGLSELVRDEQTRLFGQDMTDVISSANLDVEHQFFAEAGTTASVSREEILRLKAPVMILAGSHAKSHEVEVNINFDPTKISQPRGATKSGVAFYNNDVTQVAEMLLRAAPELKLRPEILLAAMVSDIAAVREALGSSEGVHADSMRLVRFGNATDSIAYLNSIQATL